MTQWEKETKNDINQLKPNWLKNKLENKTKARCQLGNKAKKTKQPNMVRKRKTRKQSQIEVDKKDLYILKNNYDRKRIRKAKKKKRINIKIMNFKN